jgi:glucosamine--fructose-6-phosphate aminotransferase (isomerizing)
MIEQVLSVPELIQTSLEGFDDQIRRTLDHKFCLSLKRVFLTGCGDSHHASLNAELAFESLAGVPTEPLTALQFARYAAPYLPASGPGTNAVVGVSVSGEVSRTVEALLLARQNGATTVSLTATPGSRVAMAGDYVIFTTTPPFPDLEGVYTPGVRSFTANQLALYLIAIRIGEVRGALTTADANQHRQELLALAKAGQKALPGWNQTAHDLAESWKDAQEFVFVGGGPNFGSALFSAAKVLEASGDPALGQDTEEWAHLQYFARAAATPTILISAGERDRSRLLEVATAARVIGRRLAVVFPPRLAEQVDFAQFVFPLPAETSETYSPLLTTLPGCLIAAHRAAVINEPFFRNFGGGRDVSGGGGISRIRTSEMTIGA